MFGTIHASAIVVTIGSAVGGPARVHLSAPAVARARWCCTADSVYASVALRALIDSTAASGREVPAALRGYHARIESELAILLRTAAARDGAGGSGAAAGVSDSTDEHGLSGGRERTLQVEQIESTVDWTPTASGERIEQHVIGYRSRGVTAGISAMTYLRRPWIVPVLYGNRLHVVLGCDGDARRDVDSLSGNSGGTRAGRGDTRVAVHPFSADRARYYHFAGGDTLAVIRLEGRSIPIARILVEPRRQPPGRALLFRGEVDVDAVRHQIVRMRGQFVVAGRQRSIARRVLASAWQTVVFAELTNGEFDGRFWLPTEQRVEAQGRSSLAAEFRPTFRVVSRFREHELRLATDTAALTPAIAAGPGGIVATERARLTFAPRDSMAAFGAWAAEIGAATADTRSTDFDDVAPDDMRARGAPRFDFRAERIADVLRFNRVEGAFTGAAGTYRFRDAAPGLAVGGAAGWAWSESTARGNAWMQWRRGRWMLGTRAERALANTNDFRPLLDFEQSFAALLVTADDYDYLDRRSLILSGARVLPMPGAPVLRLEVGPGRDVAERARVRYGLIHLDSAFRPNRAVAEGSYARTAVGIDVHPGVTGEFLEPGIGGGLWYERGDGVLRWQRLEARLAARHTWGPFTYAGRVDGVVVASPTPVPQQLVEFGENEGLPGYAYKEFGGDRAVLGRVGMSYDLPGGRAPIRVGGTVGNTLDRLLHRGGPSLGSVYLPGLAPSVAVGLNGGWSTATSASARAGLASFGTRVDTLTGASLLATRPTEGVRSTVNLTFRLFGGTLGAGVARPLDGHDPRAGWRLVFGIGQAF
jgi:hypothetical protein